MLFCGYNITMSPEAVTIDPSGRCDHGWLAHSLTHNYNEQSSMVIASSILLEKDVFLMFSLYHIEEIKSSSARVAL